MKNRILIRMKDTIEMLLGLPFKFLDWCSEKSVFKILVFVIVLPWIILFALVGFYISLNDWWESNESLLFHLKQHFPAILKMFWMDD